MQRKVDAQRVAAGRDVHRIGELPGAALRGAIVVAIDLIGRRPLPVRRMTLDVVVAGGQSSGAITAVGVRARDLVDDLAGGVANDDAREVDRLAGRGAAHMAGDRSPFDQREVDAGGFEAHLDLDRSAELRQRAGTVGAVVHLDHVRTAVGAQRVHAGRHAGEAVESGAVRTDGVFALPLVAERDLRTGDRSAGRGLAHRSADGPARNLGCDVQQQIRTFRRAVADPGLAANLSRGGEDELRSEVGAAAGIRALRPVGSIARVDIFEQRRPSAVGIAGPQFVSGAR